MWVLVQVYIGFDEDEVILLVCCYGWQYGCGQLVGIDQVYLNLFCKGFGVDFVQLFWEYVVCIGYQQFDFVECFDCLCYK